MKRCRIYGNHKLGDVDPSGREGARMFDTAPGPTSNNNFNNTQAILYSANVWGENSLWVF